MNKLCCFALQATFTCCFTLFCAASKSCAAPNMWTKVT